VQARLSGRCCGEVSGSESRICDRSLLHGSTSAYEPMRRSRFFVVAGTLIVIAVGAYAWRWHARGPGRPSVTRAIEQFRTSSSLPAIAEMHPPVGVYVYRGTGHEHLSFLNTKQGQGPTEPGTVTTTNDGCWTFSIQYNSFHGQSWTRCNRGDRIVERGGSTDQKFDFAAFKMSEHNDITCNAPMTLIDRGAQPGTSWPVTCRGHSRTTGTDINQSGRTTFVGEESVRVGNNDIRALHVREKLQLSGGQTGASQVDLWFDARDGLPLRQVHHISVDSPAPAPLNKVTYTEDSEWQLTSITPST
jgi:hypothetical protein